MALRRTEIAMSDDEIRVLLREVRTFTLGTIALDGSPHLSAMWFATPTGARRPGDIVFWTYRKAQKTVNMRRDHRVTCLFEAGDTYEQLRGAMIRGWAHLVENTEAVTDIGTAVLLANNPRMDLRTARAAASSQAPKRTGVRVEPTGVASWDHRKL